MLTIDAIIFEDFEKLSNVQVKAGAIPLQGFIAVELPESPGYTHYINRDKVLAFVVGDEKQDEMYDFIEPGRTILGRGK